MQPVRKIGKHYSDMSSSELKDYIKRHHLSISNSIPLRQLRETVANHIIAANIANYSKISFHV